MKPGKKKYGEFTLEKTNDNTIRVYGKDGKILE
jgi:hypothetical protein